MFKNFENFLVCPQCHSNIFNNLNEYITCKVCNLNYKIFDNIIDFRNIENDTTKAFSIKDDLKVGTILKTNFDKLKTFNGLLKFYENLKNIKNINNIDENQVSSELIKSLNHDLPMSYNQSLHGYDILKKINLFRDEFSLKNFEKKVCLENGCGHGLFIEGLSNTFEKLIVIDFSISYLMLAKKICAEKNITNVVFLCASVERLPIKKDSIDLIHSNNVIEHVTNQKEMVKEINRVLSWKGLLFLLSPNKNSAYFEPHYRIPFYGFLPFKIRHWLILKLQNRDCRDVIPLSLSELKKIIKQNFSGKFYISFLPSKLKETAQKGLLRKLVLFILKSSIFGFLFSLLINKILLVIMPYHIVIAKKKKNLD